MGPVDFFCSERHYVDHMLPVYAALPKHLRGEFHIGSRPVNPDRLTVVASYGDYSKTTGPVIFFEHGVGFVFEVKHQSYAGSPDRDRVVLFCSPNQQVYDANYGSFPETPNVIVGCPKLDAPFKRSWVAPSSPTVAFSFHWAAKSVPEAMWAYPHYQAWFSDQRHKAQKYRTLGHGHPRAYGSLSKVWDKIGWERTPHFSDVLARASVYVCDASSTIYEFAAMNRPVVVLNAPWYRRDVHTGLRFWENIPGIQVDDPKDLQAAIHEACFNDTFEAERLRIRDIVYPHLGEASDRAAAAITQFLA
jgi:hypothetical protein